MEQFHRSNLPLIGCRIKLFLTIQHRENMRMFLGGATYGEGRRCFLAAHMERPVLLSYGMERTWLSERRWLLVDIEMERAMKGSRCQINTNYNLSKSPTSPQQLALRE
jgi:hypothetical protein